MAETNPATIAKPEVKLASKELPKEVRRVGTTKLLAKASQAGIRADKMTPQEKENLKKTNKGEYALAQISWFHNLSEDGKPYAHEGHNGVVLKGEPMKMTIDGKTKTITRVDSGDAENFTCTATTSDGKTETVTVGREQFIIAQVISEEANILAVFESNPNEKMLMQNYFAVLKNPNVSFADSKAVSAAMKEVAESSGMLTADKLTEGINKLTEGKLKDAQKPEEESKIKEEKEAALKVLGGKTIVDSETVIEVLGAVGINEQSLQELTTNASLEAGKLREELGKETDPAKKSEIQKQLDEAEANAKILELASKAMGGNGFLQQALDQMAEAGIDPQRGQKLFEMLEKGDFDALVKEDPSLKPDANDDEETAEAKRIRLEKRAKRLKTAGLGVGVLFLVMYLMGSKVMGGAGSSMQG